MILAELKKILFSQKGILIILVMLVFDYFWFCDQNKWFIGAEQYEIKSQVYEMYEGALDAEKLERIKADYNYVGEDNGNISAAYRSIIAVAENNLETMDKPYLVYDWGWRTLIENAVANTPLVITGLVMSVIIFAMDAGSKVKNILNTSVNGRRKMIWSRITSYATIMFAFIVLQGVLEFLYASMLIGVRCYDAPVQSILSLCTMDISLMGAYTLVLLLEYIGVIVAGLAVCLIASVFRNMYISIVVGALVFYEGYFLSYMYDWPYLIPEHLLASYNYFQGTDVTGVLIVSVVAIAVLCIVINIINNERSRRII